jgi:hypothetical protein
MTRKGGCSGGIHLSFDLQLQISRREERRLIPVIRFNTVKTAAVSSNGFFLVAAA